MPHLLCRMVGNVGLGKISYPTTDKVCTYILVYLRSILPAAKPLTTTAIHIGTPYWKSLVVFQR